MALATTFSNQFKLDILKGGVAFGGTGVDQFKMALYSGASYTASQAAYTATGEVIGTGYSAGGVAIAPSLSPAGATTWVDFADAQWTSASFTADGCMLYRVGTGALADTGNGTTSNLNIAMWDFGSPKTVASGTFTIVMPAPDASNALIRLS